MNTPEIAVHAVPRPSWSPLPYEGCRNVEGKVLLIEDDLSVAMLRFAKNGTIHEHAGEFDADVICLEGSGYASVEGARADLTAGQRVRWPAGKMHRLWTRESEMLTLMVERTARRPTQT